MTSKFLEISNNIDDNACIGKQGSDYSYRGGYLLSAIRLAEHCLSTIEGNGEKDFLILPIIFATRHSLELYLKYFQAKILELGWTTDHPRRDHNILAQYEAIVSKKLPDQKLRTDIQSLADYIKEVCALDIDGQESRYFKNKLGERNMPSTSVVSVPLVLRSLMELRKLLSDIDYRLEDLVCEQATGTMTSELSRSDLIAIAQSLPNRSDWMSDDFVEKKAEIQNSYCLSNTQFSKALDKIQSSPPLASLIGIKFEAQHLKPDTLKVTFKYWKKHHSKSLSRRKSTFTASEILESILNDEREPISVAWQHLSSVEQADLYEIWLVGREKQFGESYHKVIVKAGKNQSASELLEGRMYHILSKTTFAKDFYRGAKSIGCEELAAVAKRFL